MLVNILKNDADRYQFTATDPKIYLNTLSIPGLWLFGEKDIQIPVKIVYGAIKYIESSRQTFRIYFVF